MQLPDQSIKLEEWKLDALFGLIVESVGIGVTASCFDVLIPLAEKLIEDNLRDASDSARIIAKTLDLLSGTIAPNPSYYLGGGAGDKELAELYNRIMKVVESFHNHALRGNTKVVYQRRHAISSVLSASHTAAEAIFGTKSKEAKTWKKEIRNFNKELLSFHPGRYGKPQRFVITKKIEKELKEKVDL